MTEHGHGHSHSHGSASPASADARSRSSSDAARSPRSNSPETSKHTTKSRARSDSYSSLYGHPAATRQSMVQAAQEIAQAGSPAVSQRKQSRPSRSHSRPAVSHEQEATLVATDSAPESTPADERTPLLAGSPSSDSPSLNAGHTHAAGGHGHGSMNMHALLLHVFGDALGNVGVIATGLVIWLSDWSFKYYFDPVISLVITVIIFSSALPLGKPFIRPLSALY